MKVRVLSSIFFSFALAAAVFAQDSSNSQNPPSAAQQDNGGGGRGQRGGRGGFGMGMGGGRGVLGTVTEVAADHYTIKTDTGDTYTVHFSANTRIMKQPAGGRGFGGGMGRGGGEGAGGGMGRGGNPPEAIKASDIKVGDALGAMGEVDATAKSVGAVMIMQLDPARAKQMEEMRANYGKTWIQGKVTAIDGTKVTLLGGMDNAAHTFVADENTTFRKRRDPITLADIQVGDTVRAEGALKDGAFTAVTVNVMSNGMGAPGGGGTPPPPPPPPAPPQ